MSGSLLSILPRSIILSAASCCSQGPGAARSVPNDATATELHCKPPPALLHAASHFVVESAMTCAIRLVRGAPLTEAAAKATAKTAGKWTILKREQVVTRLVGVEENATSAQGVNWKDRDCEHGSTETRERDGPEKGRKETKSLGLGLAAYIPHSGGKVVHLFTPTSEQ